MLKLPQYVPGEPHDAVVEATVEVIVVVTLVEGLVVLTTVDVRAPGNEYNAIAPSPAAITIAATTAALISFLYSANSRVTSG
jgi:hypothetical protein